MEVSWVAGEWHPADIVAIGPSVSWTVSWGEPWERIHATMAQAGNQVSLRIADDSGNMANFEDLAVVTGLE